MAAYNGGITNVRIWLHDEILKKTPDVSDIPFDETRAYVGKVNRFQAVYKLLYPSLTR